MKEKEILHVLPREIRGLIEEEGLDYRYLQEIKLRTGKPLLLLYRGGELLAGKKEGQPHFVTREEMREMIEYAMHCGCKMIATIHGCSMEELRKKPLIGQMIKERRFERYIVLSGTGKAGQIAGIYDERGGQLC